MNTHIAFMKKYAGRIAFVAGMGLAVSFLSGCGTHPAYRLSDECIETVDECDTCPPVLEKTVIVREVQVKPVCPPPAPVCPPPAVCEAPVKTSICPPPVVCEEPVKACREPGGNCDAILKPGEVPIRENDLVKPTDSLRQAAPARATVIQSQDAEEIDYDETDAMEPLEVTEAYEPMEDAPAGSARTKAKFIKVVDGSTIRVELDGAETDVRLADLASPAMGKDGLDEAAALLRVLIDVDEVELEFAEGQPQRDANGTLPAIVYADNINLNKTMEKNGFAAR